jgi:hypothetical protein
MSNQKPIGEDKSDPDKEIDSFITQCVLGTEVTKLNSDFDESKEILKAPRKKKELSSLDNGWGMFVLF